VLDEPTWELLRQRCDGELVFDHQSGEGEFDYIEVFYSHERWTHSDDGPSPSRCMAAAKLVRRCFSRFFDN